MALCKGAIPEGSRSVEARLLRVDIEDRDNWRSGKLVRSVLPATVRSMTEGARGLTVCKTMLSTLRGTLVYQRVSAEVDVGSAGLVGVAILGPVTDT